MERLVASLQRGKSAGGGATEQLEAQHGAVEQAQEGSADWQSSAHQTLTKF